MSGSVQPTQSTSQSYNTNRLNTNSSQPNIMPYVKKGIASGGCYRPNILFNPFPAPNQQLPQTALDQIAQVVKTTIEAVLTPVLEQLGQIFQAIMQRLPGGMTPQPGDPAATAVDGSQATGSETGVSESAPTDGTTASGPVDQAKTAEEPSFLESIATTVQGAFEKVSSFLEKLTGLKGNFKDIISTGKVLFKGLGKIFEKFLPGPLKYASTIFKGAKKLFSGAKKIFKKIF